MRYFFCSGEPSGESSAILLANAIRSFDPEAQFEGIGAAAMRAAGFRLWRDHTGWASMGPLAALPRIPKLLVTMWRTASHLQAIEPNLIVLVDFGVFNLRLATTLRRRRYGGPILDVFPPGTWLDNPQKARAVSAVAVPLTAFEHQYAFYRSLGRSIAYFGHPLTAQYSLRPPRRAPPSDGGTVAILPGSRAGELQYHLPLLIEAFTLLRRRRPRLQAVFGAADDCGAKRIATKIARSRLHDASIVRGTAEAIANADAAWVASGTAVLETVLSGVPVVAMYVVASILARHGRTMIKHRFITLPNLVLEREIVPELLQEQASPCRLAEAMESVLTDPSVQYAHFAELRAKLGPPDALRRCAAFAVALARSGAERPWPV